MPDEKGPIDIQVDGIVTELNGVQGIWLSIPEWEKILAIFQTVGVKFKSTDEEFLGSC